MNILVGRPELLFLDEPTASFDPRARRDFHDLVHRLSDLEGTTILLTTHDLALGLLATLPWGAIIGSLVKSPKSAFGVTMLPIVGLTAISGSSTRSPPSPGGSRQWRPAGSSTSSGSEP